MVSKYKAVNDWEDKLREKSQQRGKRILTMELENLWLTNRPILFKGSIKDISNLDVNYYIMKLDVKSRLSGEMALTLKSPKNMIDSFLSAHPKASSDVSIVAVIATIDRIDTNYRKTEEGDEEEIRTGVGRCVDILLYSENFLEYFIME